MPRRKSPLEPRASRKRAYELPGMTTLRAPQDPIREIENEAIRDLSNEYRQLRIEEMIAKKRKQLDSGATSSIQKEKESLDLFKTFAEIQKMSQGPDRTLEYLKFYNSMIQGQGTPGFFEQYARARELGIVNPSEPGNPNRFSVDLEKIRNERMMESKKIDLELMKMRLEAEDGREKLSILASALSPFVAVTGAKMAEDMRKQGSATAVNWGNPNNPNAYQDFLKEQGIVSPGALQGKTGKMLISCDCGFSESMLVPIPPPPSIACPNCGKTLNTAPQSGNDDEIGSEWRRGE